MNADVITAIEKLFKDSKDAKAKGLSTWFEVAFPDLEKAFFIVSSRRGSAIASSSI